MSATRLAEEDQAVAVNDFLAFVVGQNFPDLGTVFSADLGDFSGGELGDSAADQCLGWADDVDDVASAEGAFAGDNSFGEEAFAVFDKGFGGSGVDADGAAAGLEKGEPAFLGFERSAGGEKVGAGVVAGEDFMDDIGFGAAGDEDAAAGAVADSGRFEFRDHAADGGGTGCAAREFADVGIHLADDRDDFPGSFHVNQSGSRGEDDEVVGPDEARDRRGENVVVAEFDFNLLGADRVVFVDDRDDAIFEESLEGGAGVQVAFP